MKHLTIPIFAITLFATPVTAQEDDGWLFPKEDDLQEWGEFGSEMMDGLLGKIAPMVEQLRQLVDDINAYEAPEILPNGDIIIRRKEDAPPPEQFDDPDAGIAL